MTTQPVGDSDSETSSERRRFGLERLRGEYAARFIKFGTVGALGVVVNWVFFEVGYFAFAFLSEQWAVLIGYVIGLVVSIFTNFVLNDVWTWADRVKGGMRHWFYRMGKYYVSASVAGVVQLAVSWFSLQALYGRLDLYFGGLELPFVPWEIPAFDPAPRLGLLTGILCGMVINFLASHLWAFEDAETA